MNRKINSGSPFRDRMKNTVTCIENETENDSE